MIRIANVTLPDRKRLLIALTYIHGIGRSTSEKILADLKVDLALRVKDVDEALAAKIRKVIDEHHVVEGDLRRNVSMNIKLKKDIKCYEGLRHMRGLPLNGQNTHSNAKTAKKRNRR